MKLAKVTGTVVSTRKHHSIDGLKILMIQPLDDDLKPAGLPIAAIDTVQAGPSDLVWWIMAREATLTLPDTFAPVDAAICGIVDDVNNENKKIVDREQIFKREED